MNTRRLDNRNERPERSLPKRPISENHPHTIEIPKNDGAVIRISLTRFKGRSLVDLRTWIRDDGGTFIPTKRGISLSVEQLGTLIGALKRLRLDVPEARG